MKKICTYSRELFFFPDEQAAKEVSKEERVRDYRVKVNYRAVSGMKKKSKREAVAQVIGQALRCLNSM
jgi:hypothetical protein